MNKPNRSASACDCLLPSAALLHLPQLMLSLLLPLAAHAQDNPFNEAAQASYAGRFSGANVELRLVPEAGRWSGSLVFRGKPYTVEGQQKPGGFEGKFAEGAQSWPFTALVDGDGLTFSTEGVTSKLERKRLPKLEGRWRSARVLIALAGGTNETTGRIQFNGQDYTLAAQEKAGDLEGVFKLGDKSFPFRVANEPRGLVFTTGTFAEVITPMPNEGTLRVQTTPAVNYTLSNDGQAVASRDGVFTFPGGQALRLELGAKGYQPARTHLTVPDYGEATWAVALAQLPSVRLDQPWTNTLGMKFVPVTGTKVLFSIWDVRVKDYAAYAAASSGVDGSWKQPGFAQEETHPVVNVSWDEAKAFCKWLTVEERAKNMIGGEQEYRLPTDAEWSVAVGLNENSSGKPKDKDGKTPGAYPWDSSWPPPRGAGNYAPSLKVDDFKYTSPAGNFAANQFGLYDMGGSVWQWCEDSYDGERYYRVLRGASWHDVSPADLMSSRRNYYSFVDRFDYVGFRCVLASGMSR